MLRAPPLRRRPSIVQCLRLPGFVQVNLFDAMRVIAERD
jgi:hypothetical protein